MWFWHLIKYTCDDDICSPKNKKERKEILVSFVTHLDEKNDDDIINVDVNKKKRRDSDIYSEFIVSFSVWPWVIITKRTVFFVYIRFYINIYSFIHTWKTKMIKFHYHLGEKLDKSDNFWLLISRKSCIRLLPILKFFCRHRICCFECITIK